MAETRREIVARINAEREAEVQRQAMLAEVERQAELDRLAALREEARLRQEANVGVGTPSRVKAALDAGKVPVHLGNLFGPEGNVFNVIGALKSAMRWYEQQGAYYVLTDEQLATVNDYRNRKYDETIDMIAEHFEDLDDAIWRYKEGMHEQVREFGPPRWGDNPIGSITGQAGKKTAAHRR